jgi:hypothetical protein
MEPNGVWLVWRDEHIKSLPAFKAIALIVRANRAIAMRWEGSAMLRRSPRRTLEAIATQAVALIVALGGSNFKRSLTKQAQSKNIELPGSRHDISLSYARAVATFARARWQR